MSDRNWEQEASNDADEMLYHFIDTIAECARDDVVKSWLNDQVDVHDYVHENCTEEYTLLEAAQMLDALSAYTETDSGLWQGLEPKQAICAQAAYTYHNAVHEKWHARIKDLNDILDITSPSTEEDNREGIARLFVLLHSTNTSTPSMEGMLASALEELELGEFPNVGPLCDYLEDIRHGQALEFRKAYTLAISKEETKGVVLDEDEVESIINPAQEEGT